MVQNQRIPAEWVLKMITIKFAPLALLVLASCATINDEGAVRLDICNPPIERLEFTTKVVVYGNIITDSLSLPNIASQRCPGSGLGIRDGSISIERRAELNRILQDRRNKTHWQDAVLPVKIYGRLIYMGTDYPVLRMDEFELTDPNVLN